MVSLRFFLVSRATAKVSKIKYSRQNLLPNKFGRIPIVTLLHSGMQNTPSRVYFKQQLSKTSIEFSLKGRNEDGICCERVNILNLFL